MTTLADLRIQVRDRLDEPSAAFWSDAQLDRFINEGAREVARRAEVLQSLDEITVISGTREYLMAPDTVRVHRVEYHDTSDQISSLEYRDFNNMDSVWWTRQATSSGHPYWFTMWGYPPNLKLVVYPAPSESGDTLRVFYYSVPGTIAGDSTEVPCPQGWEDLIVMYAEYVAMRKDSDPRWQEAKALYEQKLSEMMDLTRRWSDQAGVISGGASFQPGWLYGDGY